MNKKLISDYVKARYALEVGLFGLARTIFGHVGNQVNTSGNDVSKLRELSFRDLIDYAVQSRVVTSELSQSLFFGYSENLQGYNGWVNDDHIADILKEFGLDYAKWMS